MEPVINPWLFYLIELADGLKLVFGGLGFAIGLVLIISGQFDGDCTYDESVKKKCQKKKKIGLCSPLTGVTSDSWDTPAGHRVYDACRGFSVSWVCRDSGASSASSTSC